MAASEPQGSPTAESRQDLAAWDANAEGYAQLVTGPHGPVTPELRRFLHRSLGNLAGRSVLDLGCGNGWLSGEVEELGGRVVGIDGSERLLALARRAHPSVEFVLADLTEGLPPMGPRRFDRVVAQMVLMTMAQLDRLLSDIGRCLLPNGRFIFTIPHPAFFGHPVDPGPAGGVVVAGYLDHQVRWITTAGRHRHYHRPLSWYVNRLAASGMAVVGLFEPPAPEDPVAHWPRDVPTLLGAVAIAVTPGLSLPVGPPSPLVDEP